MYKIQNSLVVKALLVFIPFISVISHNVNKVLPYIVIIFLLALLALSKSRQFQLNTSMFFYTMTMMFFLYISLIYQYLVYDNISIYYIQFYGSQSLFFLIFIYYVNVQQLFAKINSVFIFIIVVIFLFVLIDYILLQNNMVTSQLMYRDYAVAYHYKPLGLFGQFSVTSATILFFYMLYLYNSSLGLTWLKFFLFLIVSLTIFLQHSGTGYILYFIFLLTLLWELKSIKYLVIPVLVGLFSILIVGDFIYKISFTYILFLFDFFYNIFTVHYLENLNSSLDLLFGIDGNYNFPIDFGPLFMIAKVGILYFLMYSIALVYIMIKANDIKLKVGISMLLIASLHYPVLFYPIMNIFLPLLVIYILTLKHGMRKYIISKRLTCVE